MNIKKQCLYWNKVLFYIYGLFIMFIFISICYSSTLTWLCSQFLLRFFAAESLWGFSVSLILIFLVSFISFMTLFSRISLFSLSKVFSKLQAHYSFLYNFLYRQKLISANSAITANIFARGVSNSLRNSSSYASVKSIKRVIEILETLKVTNFRADFSLYGQHINLSERLDFLYLLGEAGELFMVKRYLKRVENPFLLFIMFLWPVLLVFCFYIFLLRTSLSEIETAALLLSLPCFGMIILENFITLSHIKSDRAVRRTLIDISQEFIYLLFSATLKNRVAKKRVLKRSIFVSYPGEAGIRFNVRLFITNAQLQEIIHFLQFFNIDDVTNLLAHA